MVYKLVSDKITYFIGCIMDGSKLISKYDTENINHCHIFGLPLTTEILIEIICGGWTSEDSKVSNLTSINIYKHLISSISTIQFFLFYMFLCYVDCYKFGKYVVTPNSKRDFT